MNEIKKLIWGSIYNNINVLDYVVSKRVKPEFLEKISMEACSLSGVLFKKIKNDYWIVANKDIKYITSLSVLFFAEDNKDLIKITTENFTADMSPKFGEYLILGDGASIVSTGENKILVIEIDGNVNNFKGSSVFLNN